MVVVGKVGGPVAHAGHDNVTRMPDHPPNTDTVAARERAFLLQAVTDPSWLFQDMDLHLDRAAFVPMRQEDYQRSTFLDHRREAAAGKPAITRLSSLVAGAADREPGPINWIFHPGHVGSTLLSRLLGELDALLPLREPLPLRSLAGLWREQGDPLAQLDAAGFKRLERAIWVLLGRSFRDNQLALVKATSDCCNLLERALSAHPDSRAVWLDVDLETFLAGMLRNQARRQETRAFAQSRLMDLHRLLDDREIRLYHLDIGPLTAMSWLANQGHRLLAANSANGDRVLTLHFHDLLEFPETELSRVLEHFRMPTKPATVSRLADSPWRRTYAKHPDSPFSARQRYEQLAASRRDHAGEIEAGMAFADRLCSRHEVLAALGSYLRPPE